MSLNVEATGFEPATPRPPAECATGLRHASITIRKKDKGFVDLEQSLF